MKTATPNRVSFSVRVILFVCALLLLCLGLTTAAQTTTPRPPRPENQTTGDGEQSPLGNFEEEIRAKRAIKLAEKDHEQNLDRARQISDLASQLQAALKNKHEIDRESAKKIDRLEKLTKKIRSESGGEAEEVKIVDRPTDITSAVNQIAESAESLSKAVQNTPRQVVSASVIGNANVLLELIKLLRTFDSRP